jgi:hypothetical protein
LLSDPKGGTVNDPYDVLDCALRSQYLTLGDLQRALVWHRLPLELRSALAEAIAAGASRGTVLRLLWQVRMQQFVKTPDSTVERSQSKVKLLLGLLHLRYREGRLAADELLSLAFHYADSYICGLNARPSLRLRDELLSTEAKASEASLIAKLFEEYTPFAEGYVKEWGFGMEPNLTNG